MYVLSSYAALDDVHHDAINPASANISSLHIGSLNNALIGLVSADGNRGVMRLSINDRDGSLSIAYRVYR